MAEQVLNKSFGAGNCPEMDKEVESTNLTSRFYVLYLISLTRNSLVSGPAPTKLAPSSVIGNSTMKA